MSAIPHQLRAGNGTTTREALGGQAISLAANRAGWKHPWQITPAWQAGAGHWAAVVKPGRILFEIEGLPESVAREAFTLASYKLPIRTKFIIRD